MLEFVLAWGGGLALYSTVAFATGGAICKTFEIAKASDHPGPFFGSALWPVVLPVLLPIFVFKGVKKLKLPPLLRSKTREQKFQDYAQSPVKVLTQILVYRIQKEPNRFFVDGIRFFEWRSSDGKIKIRGDRPHCDEPFTAILRVEVDGKRISYEEIPLIKAMNKALDHGKEIEKAEAERKKQLEALDAVEVLLLSPVETENQA